MNIPTITEVRSFIHNEKLNVDADAFYDYCEKREWKMADGKPIDRWQAIAIICHRKGSFRKKRTNSVITDRDGCKRFTDENGTQWSVIDEDHPDSADDIYRRE